MEFSASPAATGGLPNSGPRTPPEPAQPPPRHRGTAHVRAEVVGHETDANGSVAPPKRPPPRSPRRSRDRNEPAIGVSIIWSGYPTAGCPPCSPRPALAMNVTSRAHRPRQRNHDPAAQPRPDTPRRHDPILDRRRRPGPDRQVNARRPRHRWTPTALTRSTPKTSGGRTVRARTTRSATTPNTART